MSPPLQCRIAARWADLEPLQEAWDALVRAHPRPQVFFTFAWHQATWRAFGDGSALAVALVSRGELLVGVLPLMRRRGRSRFEFAGAPHADYADLLLAADEAGDAVLIAALRGLEGAGVTTLNLRHVPSGGNLAAVVSGESAVWLQSPFAARWRATQGDPCPALVCEGEDGRKLLEEKLRKKSLRRHENGLRRQGELRFERLSARDAVRAQMPAFRAQHQERRAMAGDQTLFASPESRAFYDALVEEFDPATVLHVTALQVAAGPARSSAATASVAPSPPPRTPSKHEATLAAMHFGFVFDERMVWYKPTIAVDLWDYGPGEVLIKRLLEMMRDEGLREFDFTRGDESFKSRFANVVRHNTDHQLLPAGKLAGTRLAARDAVLGAIKRRPWLAGSLRRMQRGTTELRRMVRKHGVARLAWKGVAQAWFRKGPVRDEVLVFRAASVSGDGATQPEHLEIRFGQLSDLARAAADHGEHFDGTRLQSARKRLKRGDRLVVAYRLEPDAPPAFAHAAWFGSRDTIIATEVGTEIELALPRMGTVIYDCWTPASARGHGVYPHVLRWILSTLASGDSPDGDSSDGDFSDGDASNGEDAWIYCLSNNHASRRGIEKAGFVPQHRMTRLRLLGRRLSGGVSATKDPAG